MLCRGRASINMVMDFKKGQKNTPLVIATCGALKNMFN